jgi:CBS domain-containing protein
METVRTVLKNKSSEVFSVSKNTSVFDALKLMAEKSIGAVLVVEDRALVGILSERDYARKIALRGKSSKDCIVGDIMTEQVITVESTTHIEECMELMNSRKVRHLPVVDNGTLVGVISIGDVLKAILNHKEFVINQLQDYIKGNS